MRFSRAKPLPSVTSEQLEADLERGRLYPAYLLFGPEAYLLRRAVRSLTEKAVPPETRAFNLVELSARSVTAARIVHEANSFPMISGRRLVLVTDLEELPAEEHEVLTSYLAAPQEKSVLVLTASEIDRRTSFYKDLLERTCVVEFPKLRGPALEDWAGRMLSRRGYHIGSAALRKLVDLSGADLLTVVNEIEKLILYVGAEKQIPDAAIDTLIPASRQHSIFELTSALGRRDRKAALKSLGNLLEAGEPPLAIVSMLARHFRQVLIAKELLAEGRPPQDIGRLAQIPGFLLQEFLRQARALDLDLARRMFQHLAAIDRSFKSSSPDERLLLEHWICSL